MPGAHLFLISLELLPDVVLDKGVGGASIEDGVILP